VIFANRYEEFDTVRLHLHWGLKGKNGDPTESPCAGGIMAQVSCDVPELVSKRVLLCPRFFDSGLIEDISKPPLTLVRDKVVQKLQDFEFRAGHLLHEIVHIHWLEYNCEALTLRQPGSAAHLPGILKSRGRFGARK